MSAQVEAKRESMKAAHVTKWCVQGTVPNTILLDELPVPRAPVGQEVLVSVKASAINVDDIFLLQDTAAGGWFFHLPKPSQVNPLVGGLEYAGVVLACGPDCKRLKVGDRVCGLQDVYSQKYPGTWAEQTLSPEKFLVALPPELELSFVQAAAIPMGAFVAGDMYKHTKFPAKSGRCLVLGASGGLGTVMLQLLRKHSGESLHVTAVCSTSNVEKMQRLGADEVVDYKQGPLGKQLTGKDKFDIIYDFVGGTEYERELAQLLQRKGQYITAVGPTQGVGDRELTCCEFTGSLCTMMSRVLSNCLPCSRYQYTMSGAFPPLTEKDFQRFVVEAGARAEVALEVPFAEQPLREALRRAESRHPGGKIVINMESES